MIGSDLQWFSWCHMLLFIGAVFGAVGVWQLQLITYARCISHPFSESCDPEHGNIIGPVCLLVVHTLAWIAQTYLFNAMSPRSVMQTYTTKELRALCEYTWRYTYFLYCYSIMTWRTSVPYVHEYLVVTIVCTTLDLALIHLVMWKYNLRYTGHEPVEDVDNAHEE